MKYNILIVDDEHANLRLLERLLSAEYNVLLAESGAAALNLLAGEQVAMIVTDQRMPGMTGIEFLKRAEAIAPQTVRMIITGYTDAEALVEAINSGVVYKYITKPWINSDLKTTIQRGLQHYEAQRAQRSLQERYTKAVAETDEVRSSFRKFVGALLQLQNPIGHAQATRINQLAVDLAQEMGLLPPEVEELQLAIFLRAMLHGGTFDRTDSVGDSVAQALQAVTKFEAGTKVLSGIPLLHSVVTSIRQFNERYDGWGYPDRLAGENIMPIARIGAIVTAFHEMTAPDNNQRVTPAEAAENIRNAAGTRFDPRMAGAFYTMIEVRDETHSSPNGINGITTQPTVTFV